MNNLSAPTPPPRPQMVAVAVGPMETDSEMEMGRSGANTCEEEKEAGLTRGRSSNCNAIITESSAPRELWSCPSLGYGGQAFDQLLHMGIILGEAALFSPGQPPEEKLGVPPTLPAAG